MSQPWRFQSAREMSNIFFQSAGLPDLDGNGHGTHCAGTAVSSQLYVIVVVPLFSLSGAYAP